MLVAAGVAAAETQSGMVRSGGQAIPGATVTAICGTDRITTVTDDAGSFEMGGLPATACRFSVGIFGFRTGAEGRGGFFLASDFRFAVADPRNAGAGTGGTRPRRRSRRIPPRGNGWRRGSPGHCGGRKYSAWRYGATSKRCRSGARWLWPGTRRFRSWWGGADAAGRCSSTSGQRNTGDAGTGTRRPECAERSISKSEFAAEWRQSTGSSGGGSVAGRCRLNGQWRRQRGVSGLWQPESGCGASARRRFRPRARRIWRRWLRWARRAGRT